MNSYLPWNLLRKEEITFSYICTTYVLESVSYRSRAYVKQCGALNLTFLLTKLQRLGNSLAI